MNLFEKGLRGSTRRAHESSHMVQSDRSITTEGGNQGLEAGKVS